MAPLPLAARFQLGSAPPAKYLLDLIFFKLEACYFGGVFGVCLVCISNFGSRNRVLSIWKQLAGAPKTRFLRVLILVLLLLRLLIWFAYACFSGRTLLEIKKSFHDVDNVLYDWSGDGAPPRYCSRRGVLCDNVTFAVAALNLSGLSIGGEISPAIGNLKGVVSIDLRSNELSRQIPDEIGDCSSLKTLDLSSNNLEGDIPFSISKLKRLENLVLKNNQLVGVIPSTLSQLPNLKILDLAQNKLNGEIPRLIYWNEVLQYLGLRSNNLEGSLSPDMCQLTGLWYFDVKNNSLTGTIPETIGNCTSFQGFVLQSAYWRNTIQHWFPASGYIIFAREQVLWPYSISDWPYAGACSAGSEFQPIVWPNTIYTGQLDIH